MHEITSQMLLAEATNAKLHVQSLKVCQTDIGQSHTQTLRINVKLLKHCLRSKMYNAILMSPLDICWSHLRPFITVFVTLVGLCYGLWHDMLFEILGFIGFTIHKPFNPLINFKYLFKVCQT